MRETILLTGAVAAALGIIWRTLAVPGWRLMVLAVGWSKAHQTLIGIASEFEPNEGSSLRDIVDRLEGSQIRMDRRLEQVDGKMDSLVNMVETHIVDQRSGGRRGSDPGEP